MIKKTIKIFIIILGLALIIGAGFLINSRYHIFKDLYYCPMHPNYTSDKPGDCTICGMKLVKKEEEHKTILYYRNPMNPEVTSPVPMKDPMGMDYVPVYENEGSTESKESGIYISPEKQQLIGVKNEKIQKRRLIRHIQTVGKIAYDPELYVAQEEYLQAYKAYQEAKKNNLSDILIEQTESLLRSSKRKVMLQGMSERQINELIKRSSPNENLYLPSSGDAIWVYITVYEYEIGLVKYGQPVEIEAIAYPGEKFYGNISSISPVLDPMTRSVQVRAEVKNPGNRLKPEMFVNVKIKIDLGIKLAVPEEAVMDTGERTIVFVAKPDGYFETREPRLGTKANGYYEVLSGLKEGETIVTSGNFFVDSESRLKSAIK